VRTAAKEAGIVTENGLLQFEDALQRLGVSALDERLVAFGKGAR
jgi:hypothetical protein